VRTRLLALLALLLLPRPGAGAEPAPAPERARRPTCRGIYTGAARGVFWCKVVALHDPKTGRSSFRVETEDDIQLTGDALQVTPGGLEWKGAPAVGALRSGDAAVISAWSALQTGQPPNQADYAAAHAAPKVPVEQGLLTLTLTSAAAAATTDGVQAFTLHGTWAARLLPLRGSKAVGEVQVTVTF
jgi:hypothetical protein